MVTTWSLTMSQGGLDPDMSQILSEVRRRGVTYPIPDLADFVRQMSSIDERVVFRGVAYDTDFAAGLMPPFLFPVTSEEDLVRKATELLVARGLRPLSDLQDGS